MLELWSPNFIRKVGYSEPNMEEMKERLIQALKEARAAQEALEGLGKVLEIMREKAGLKLFWREASW